MRLRPSQFVFLLLLACSVQVREDYALRLTAAVISGSARTALHPSSIAAASKPQGPQAAQAFDQPQQAVGLGAAAHAAHRAIWSMRRPALQSTSVASFTSFFRA